MRVRGKRGMVFFGMAIVTALAGSITAYALMLMANSEARRGILLSRRTVARYLAEAAYVRLREFLWQNPAACTAGVAIDHDGDTTTPDLVVGANQRKTITLNTTY